MNNKPTDARLKGKRRRIIFDIEDEVGLPFTTEDQEAMAEACEYVLQKRFDIRIVDTHIEEVPR